jgi:hypothetical protein
MSSSELSLNIKDVTKDNLALLTVFQTLLKTSAHNLPSIAIRQSKYLSPR